MRPSPFAPDRPPASNEPSGEFIREESGVRGAPTGPSGKKPDLTSIYKRFDARSKEELDMRRERDLALKQKYEEWVSPRVSPPPLPLEHQSPIERQTGTTVFARQEPHRRTVMPPLPLAPRFPGEDQHGQTTYVRGHAQQFDYAPEAAPVTNPVEDVQKPWALSGQIDGKTQRYFQDKRESLEQKQGLFKLIREASDSIDRSQREAANAKRTLTRLTDLARKLDNGTGRLGLNANLEEVDNDILEDL